MSNPLTTRTSRRRRRHRGAATTAMLAGLLAISLDTATEAAAKPFTMTKSGLERNCARYGGTFSSYSTGGYSCTYPDNGVTECTKKKVCNHYPARGMPLDQTRAPGPDASIQPAPIVPPPNPQPSSDDAGAAVAQSV